MQDVRVQIAAALAMALVLCGGLGLWLSAASERMTAVKAAASEHTLQSPTEVGQFGRVPSIGFDQEG